MKKLFTLLFITVFLNVSAQTWTHYTSADGLIEGITSSLIQDTDGNLWFGDWSVDNSAGIGKFDGMDFSYYDTSDGAPSNAITSVFQDSSDNYWFATFDDQGVSKFDGTTWTNYTTADGLISDFIWEIDQDSQGNMWFVGFGLSKFDGTSWTNYETINGQYVYATSMIESSNGDFWFTRSSGLGLGLAKFDGVTWTSYTTADGFSSDEPGAIFQDSNDNIWVGSYDGTGIDKFDGTDVTIYSFADGIANLHIRYSGAIAEGSDGTLYFGTNFGVAVFDGLEWTSIALAAGLPDEVVRSIIEDTDGNLWIGTFTGLSKYNPTLGVFDTLKDSFTIYPNPVNALLNVKSETKITLLQIYSMSGENVLSASEDEITQVNINRLSQGIYWVKVENEDGQTGFKKVIVN